MTRWLPGFDDRLTELLAQCARDAGEDVDTYVARAVAAQMVADLQDIGGAGLRGSLTRMTQAAADGVVPRGVIADPQRLRALYATGQLDSPTEESYDRITRAAADALDAPFAALTLVDDGRLFFKSAIGMSGTSAQVRQIPLSQSLCEFTVARGAPLVVGDATTDPAFETHPAVSQGNLVAYLGIPFGDADGNVLGSLYVSDIRPRRWGTGHIRTLSDFTCIAAERLLGGVA
ncbi:signal transduction protein containing GAF and PtsI domains [Mycolicibacterium chubuense NBB4]|uniref:Signal transduction protein containing GAF and PtsI domains n=1 Tax=Mycolicibacterium chubuense (strain NBB4) TaxID=710421 RepID=I4BCU6_MYCCN|nr:GAF domain-containing protein [Mycolicibacterium chubuense]AFM15103.1 signal transduction protein containing GAF and PtsI domains [Mycolicibacterium chubuense NBB4]